MTSDHLSPEDCAKEVRSRTLEYLKAGWEERAIYATISRFVSDCIAHDVSRNHAYEHSASKAMNEAYEAFKAMADLIFEQEKAEYKGEVLFGTYFNSKVEGLADPEARIHRVAYTAMYANLLFFRSQDIPETSTRTQLSKDKAHELVGFMDQSQLEGISPDGIRNISDSAIAAAECDVARYRADFATRCSQGVKQ